MFELSQQALNRIRNLHLACGIEYSDEQEMLNTVAVEIFEIMKKRKLSHFQAKTALEVAKVILDEDMV